MQTNYKPVEVSSAIAFLSLIAALCIVGPLSTIWAVNTLFGTSIAFTFKNWAAVLTLWFFARNKITLN